jgi:GGDEF domain-containing protein
MPWGGRRSSRTSARIRRAALAVPHASSRAGGVVTISQGVAAMAPGSGDDPANLLEAADRALYRAKARGDPVSERKQDDSRSGQRMLERLTEVVSEHASRTSAVNYTPWIAPARG